MSSAPLNTEDLLKVLDEQHQAYLKTSKRVHEAIGRMGQTEKPLQPNPAVLTNNNLALPLSPASPVSRSPSKRRRRSTTDIEERPPQRTGPFQSSIFTGDSDESDEDGDLYVQQSLPSYAYDLEHLRAHLKTYNFEEAGKILLGPVMKDGKLKYPSLFSAYPPDEKWHNSHYSVFDVGKDGAPLNRWEVVKPGTASIDNAIWQAIQDLNANLDARLASGRITIVREPSPIIFGALHLTLSQDFDMDEIFRLLVDEDHSNAHIINRPFLDEQRQQRTFIFNFDYHTIVGDEAQPMPWQRTDKPEKLKHKAEDHIQISRCSSVIALSLLGIPVKKLRNSARRAITKHGFVYDPWAPWHVLNIQCYPDHKHSMDSHDSTKHYVNGPEAFLTTLLAEFKDAEKRFQDINTRINKLIAPDADFMFDGKLRDTLLFEDKEFTYSRRYFWAFQTLGIMNTGIKDIIDGYYNTFTDDVWEGRSRSLWPMLEETSPRNIYWRKRLAGLKRDFEKQVKSLQRIFKNNDDCRKEIRTLRDQLFSGTSVLESRKSVELSEVTILQGHNIKLLTLVSIFFLPLTFVTSVFGMSNMPTREDYKVFGIVISVVCVPFFLLIGSLNTTTGMYFWRSKWHQVSDWIRGVKKVEEKSEDDFVHARPPGSLKKDKRSLSASTAIETRMAMLKPFQDSSSSSVRDAKKGDRHLLAGKSLASTNPIKVAEITSYESTTGEKIKHDKSMSSVRAPSIAPVGKVLGSLSWPEKIIGRKSRRQGHEHDV